MTEKNFSHFDSKGNAQMVDVTDKASTDRTAVAKGEILMNPDTLQLIQDGGTKKGDVLGVARVAGISGGKRTSDLIPLCHPLPLTHLSVDFNLKPELPGIEIVAAGKTTGKTGVEMEALTAVSVAALTIYDMAKSVDKTMRIQNIRLVSKRGGKSGEFSNE